jgi:hypothetical protein
MSKPGVSHPGDKNKKVARMGHPAFVGGHLARFNAVDGAFLIGSLKTGQQ